MTAMIVIAFLTTHTHATHIAPWPARLDAPIGQRLEVASLPERRVFWKPSLPKPSLPKAESPESRVSPKGSSTAEPRQRPTAKHTHTHWRL